MTWLRRAVAGHPVGICMAALALVVVAPLLSPGFTLVYDMVFVPHPHFTADLVGLSGIYPRTVPTEAWVAGLSWIVGGAVVQKAVLFGIFMLAGLGAANLAPAERNVGRIAAGVLYAWNPMTYERLLLGQWSLLLGYAVLPWAVSAAVHWRARTPGSSARLVLALAGLTLASPYLGLLGGAIALIVAMWPPPERGTSPGASAGGSAEPRGRVARVIAGFVAVNLVWLVPALLHPSQPARSALGVELFRAGSDSPLGTFGSLVSLGGIWRGDLAPPGRTTIAWIPAFVLIVVIAIGGVRRFRAAWPTGARRGLVAAAIAGVALAAAPWFPPTAGLMRWIAGTSAAAGFLRDSQKFVIPWALLLAITFGLGVDRLALAVAGRDRVARSAVIVASLLPIAMAPTLAWAAGGRLHTVSYPDSWSRVERITRADSALGAILVLPWHAYLPFDWNPGATVHQPAGWYFSRHVVAATALEVDGRTVPGEDAWSRLAAPVAGGSGPLAGSLAGLGIRYVLAFHIPDPTGDPSRLAGLRPVLRTGDLTLARVPGPVTMPQLDRTPWAPVAAGGAVGAVVVVLAAGAALRSRRRAHAPATPTADQMGPAPPAGQPGGVADPHPTTAPGDGAEAGTPVMLATTSLDAEARPR